MALCMLAMMPVHAQVTTPANAGSTGDFVGWDNTMINDPLMIRHDANQPIDWYTDAIQRVTLSPTYTGQTVNGYTGVDLSGFLGIGPFSITPVDKPQAMVHLDGGSNEDSGWRPWMKQGTYITYTTDQAYLGLKAEANDQNHLTLAWSDNGLLGEPDGPDQLRFIFTRDNVGTTLAAGIHGLEAGRFTPATSCNEVFFGLGHFQGTGLNPVDRLHLLNGRIRVTQLPTDPPANTMTKVLVVDDSFTPEYGVIKYRDISTMQDCDWHVNGVGDVITAWSLVPDPGCPDNTNNVGIGILNPRWKLHVVESSPDPFGDDKAIFAHVIGDEGMNIAVDAFSPTPAAEVNLAFRGWAQDARANYGLFAHTTVTIPHIADQNIGVYGNAQEEGTWSQGGGVANACIGVWGRARCAASNTWAGFFEGNVYASGVYASSDQALKTDVAAVTDALAATMQLEPVMFHFDTIMFDHLGLPSTLQSGLIAQDVEQVMPHLVRSVTRPAVLDTAGAEVEPAVTFKAVNYSGIIPYLIGAVQELKSANDAQQAQISALQQDLASCCAANGDADLRSMGSGAGAGAGAGEALRTDLFILPNPVADHTQLRYTVATPGRTRLEVSDASGKRLEVLEEAVREVGTYTHDWTTTDLAPGTYHCTLYLNDSFVVKKAVKVAR